MCVCVCVCVCECVIPIDISKCEYAPSASSAGECATDSLEAALFSASGCPG